MNATDGHLLKSPLQSAYPAGTRFVASANHETPLHFGDPSGEWQAVSAGAAIADRSHLGRLRQEGGDAIDLLHRLTTNNIEAVPVGGSVRTVLATDRGRVVDAFRVVRTEKSALLLLCSGVFKERLSELIDFYTIIEDSTLTDISEDTVQIELSGPEADERLSGVLPFAASIAEGATAEHEGVRVIRGDGDAGGGFALISSPQHGLSLWGALVSSGFTPVGEQAILRQSIRRGEPSPGIDFDEGVNPLEAGLMDLVDFTKGCYVGQEVIARLDTYEKVQRRLVEIRSDFPVSSGDTLFKDGRKVGRIGSVVEGEEGVEGLALVRNEFAETGTALKTEKSVLLSVVERS